MMPEARLKDWKNLWVLVKWWYLFVVIEVEAKGQQVAGWAQAPPTERGMGSSFALRLHSPQFVKLCSPPNRASRRASSDLCQTLLTPCYSCLRSSVSKRLLSKSLLNPVVRCRTKDQPGHVPAQWSWASHWTPPHLINMSNDDPGDNNDLSPTVYSEH